MLNNVLKMMLIIVAIPISCISLVHNTRDEVHINFINQDSINIDRYKFGLFCNPYDMTVEQIERNLVANEGTIIKDKQVFFHKINSNSCRNSDMFIVLEYNKRWEYFKINEKTKDTIYQVQ